MHILISKLVPMFSNYKVVAFLETSKKFKSNLHYILGNTSKRVTSGGAHLRNLAPGQHRMKNRRSGGDLLATLSVYNLTGLEVEPLPPTPKTMLLLLYQPAGYLIKSIHHHQMH